VIVIEETWRMVSILSSPSSSGSYTSVISVEEISVIWCRLGILLLMISAMVTVLLMARPMAFNTTSVKPFSLKRVVA
jgi:hypothetical protein